MSVYRRHELICKKSLKTPQKLVELIHLVKCQDTKSTHKNQYCFYTLTMNLSKGITKITLPTIATEIKHLQIYLTKKVKVLYNEHHERN
jgi:hypothetical protein